MIRPEADTVEYFDFDWLEKKQFDQAMGKVIRFCLQRHLRPASNRDDSMAMNEVRFRINTPSITWAERM
jgi:hypothetical protein